MEHNFKWKDNGRTKLCIGLGTRPDYMDETVSMKVVRIIQGYVNVVNKMVWRKDQ